MADATSPALDPRLDLRSHHPAELAARVRALGQPAYRAEQVFRWLHARGVETLEAMTNIPAELRQALTSVPMPALGLDLVQRSADGTQKMRFKTQDGRSIESVLIPDDDPVRNKLTLCISSQAGCAIDCQFCATATLGFGRHLAAGEIVQQVYHAIRLGERRPTNLVFMGMGEPLHNFENVSRALAILQHPWGVAISPRRITVSTSGLVPGIEKLGALAPAPNLAISLNATTDEVRSRIMPINNKWPLEALLGAARRFPLSHGRRVTFEYVLLAGVNDSDADAERLPRLLKGIPTKLNLIPWNPFPGSPFERPSPERVLRFQEIVRRTGLPAYIRTPRGDDIDAACGQLAAREEPGIAPPAPWPRASGTPRA